MVEILIMMKMYKTAMMIMITPIMIEILFIMIKCKS